MVRALSWQVPHPQRQSDLGSVDALGGGGGDTLGIRRVHHFVPSMTLSCPCAHARPRGERWRHKYETLTRLSLTSGSRWHINARWPIAASVAPGGFSVSCRFPQRDSSRIQVYCPTWRRYSPILRPARITIATSRCLSLPTNLAMTKRCVPRDFNFALPKMRRHGLVVCNSYSPLPLSAPRPANEASALRHGGSASPERPPRVLVPPTS